MRSAARIFDEPYSSAQDRYQYPDASGREPYEKRYRYEIKEKEKEVPGCCVISICDPTYYQKSESYTSILGRLRILYAADIDILL